MPIYTNTGSLILQTGIPEDTTKGGFLPWYLMYTNWICDGHRKIYVTKGNEISDVETSPKYQECSLRVRCLF